ncbi:MAG TPA: phytoene/squalene synthase family protein [Micromonosporaceae bacterium]|jgi:phytoene synthase
MSAGDVLSASYERCRELHRRHGRTYYLATRLLPAWKRPHVYALYGFARYADEIVDRLDGSTPEQRRASLEAWSATFLAGLAGEAIDDPILPAVLHTIEEFDLDRADFALFLRSMAMDLTVAAYPTYADLIDYMEGSAAVIGAMMLPILGAADRAAALPPARELGRAFQLTNFIRDVGEDLDRGRIYLPQADLDRFGIETLTDRVATPAVRELIAFEVSRARLHYAAARPGIEMLDAASQPCMRTAYRLYSGILDEIERADFDVFSRRAVVPRRRQVAVAASCLLLKSGR